MKKYIAVVATLMVSALARNAAGEIELGGTITTNGDLTYSDAVVLTSDTLLVSTGGGTISFNSTVSGDYSLTVNTVGTTVFGGLVGVDSLTTDAAGTTQINASMIATAGNQTYHDAVVLGADVAFISTGSGDIAFNSMVNSTGSGSYSLAVNTAGDTVFNGVVGGVNVLSSLTTDAAGTTIFGSGAVTTIGAQTYLDAVVLGADVSFSSVSFGGDIVFASTVNGGYSLTVNAAGDAVFSGVVGGVTPLSSLTAAALGTIHIQGATIATTGSQVYSNAVVLGTDVALSSSGSGIAFNSTLNKTYAVAVYAVGTIAFNGAVGGADPLESLTVTGTAQIRGAIKTTDSQTYNDAVVLGANATFTTTATGDIVFSDTVDGTYSLAVNAAGDAVFSGVVGGVTPLSSLTANAGGGIQINCSEITTTGAQTYNAAVALWADVELTSSGSGNIVFNSTVDGWYSLTVDTAGTTVFNAAVGGVNALSSLTIAGTAQIHADILTTGSQSYNNHVTLTGNTTLTADQVDFSVSAAASGSVAIAAALNNGGYITVNGGTLNFMGAITNNATIRANNGAVLNFGTTVYNGGVIDALAGSAIFGGAFSNNGTFAEASGFLTTEIQKVGNDMRLDWVTMGGHEYVLQACATSSGGGYTNNFSDVGPVMSIAGQSLGVTNYLHVGGATNLYSRYYRIRLQQ